MRKMLSGRKQQIFFSIVENYIESGEPIGSKSLLGIFANAVSSATIRNDMAYLTELGLIDQPHTSAGRVPTLRGIRYYLDNLMERKVLSEKEKAQIDSIFNFSEPDSDRFLLKASDALSDMLSLAVIGRTAKAESRIDRIELLIPAPNMFVVVLITTNKEVKSKICVSPYPISKDAVSFFCENINKYLSSAPLSAINLSYIQSVAANMGIYGLELSPLLSAIAELAKGAEEERFFIEGEANLLIGGIADRQILKAVKRLVESGELAAIFPESSKGTEIILGSELSSPYLTPLCIIMTHFEYGGKKGSVGLIGSVRCEYSHLIPCLEYFAESFSKHFAEGEK
ncbi:MAG: heat-inducible transcription repressor HrcA [Oscillospiraceae bacterium]|nr:heat-inducible transcription repressor HrcA [Oscillospiraceae bacterium]